MEIVLFRIRTRPDLNEQEYQRTFERMLKLVSEVPGFIGIEGFSGEDGSELAVARFDSPEALATWRDQPEHVHTRQRGREEFFAAYDITIATVTRHYDWSLPQSGAREETGAPGAEKGDQN
jgi:heme-degrading monooxygenase HmoA